MDKKIFPDEPEIPILPNLFTAGNLVCGFFAILTIFEGINQADSDAVAAFSYYQNATFLIFAACLFDLFDGRIARMRGQDGPFGREFDSLADIVSFGIAPALLVAKAVLFQLSPPEVGWGIGILYLLCAALRLARFNCMAAAPRKEGQSSAKTVFRHFTNHMRAQAHHRERLALNDGRIQPQRFRNRTDFLSKKELQRFNDRHATSAPGRIGRTAQKIAVIGSHHQRLFAFHSFGLTDNFIMQAVKNHLMLFAHRLLAL